MIITLHNGKDIFDSSADALTNPVNCVGVMGKGLALQFKKRYPDNFTAYVEACRTHVLHPGVPFLFDRGLHAQPQWIINFPTKRHWRDASLLSDIETGATTLLTQLRQQRIRSLAIPPLGCGLGGLDWNSQVYPILHRTFASTSDITAYLYAPDK